MKILVLGAYGFIGSAVLTRLAAAGHEVVGLGRDVAAAERRFPGIHFVAADLSRLTSAAAWQPILDSLAPEAIVNAAGALQDGARDSVWRVQAGAMRALYEAAAARGIAKFVQISAARAARDADTAFMRSKGEADAALAATGFEWIILRPGLVLGAQAYGGTALLRAIAALPVVQPIVHADRPIQTVSVDDVAAAVEDALTGKIPVRATYDLVENDGQPLGDVVRRLRAWLGLPPARLLHVPDWAVGLASRLADALGWLGWRSPFRGTALTELAAGITGDPKPWTAATGRPFASLKETLARNPSTVQERWFAQTFLLKPLVIATLSLFWLATGLVALADVDAAAAVLTERGIGAGLATASVIGGAILDLLLGLLVLARRTMPTAARGMLLLTLVYLVGATILAPDLWADPLGPLVKAIPAFVLALVALALAHDR